VGQLRRQGVGRAVDVRRRRRVRVVAVGGAELEDDRPRLPLDGRGEPPDDAEGLRLAALGRGARLDRDLPELRREPEDRAPRAGPQEPRRRRRRRERDGPQRRLALEGGRARGGRAELVVRELLGLGPDPRD
jgi:hypothetical protein